jgi:hypothetical protein
MKVKFEAALNLLFAKKFTEAKEIFEELSISDPENPDVFYTEAQNLYSEIKAELESKGSTK